MVVSDWIIRPAVPEDEDCIASMWLRQLCHGQDARAAGLKDAAQRGSEAQISYWEQHQPIVTALVRGAQVTVACDPERSRYEPGAPAVVWGWSVCDGDIVYGVGIKRRVARAGLGQDIARALLGDRLERHQRTVMDLVDLSALRMIPQTWGRERGWISSLRQVSQRVLDGDALFRTVAEHVLDPSRERWMPSHRRAA